MNMFDAPSITEWGKRQSCWGVFRHCGLRLRFNTPRSRIFNELFINVMIHRSRLQRLS